MPGRFDEALEVARTCALAHRASDEADRLEQVARLRDLFARLCDELADAPGAPTLDHNDLHGGNVFGSGDQARFFDWGDAVVAHPFASALVLRSVARWTLDAHAESPLERRLVDAYLEPFTALAPRHELNEVLEVACEVGKVARSLVWARAVAGLPPGAEDPDGFATAPLRWMLELLEEPPVSGG
jgi:Ser/Thr protein kinase RdoA (MazF antagonist)